MADLLVSQRRHDYEPPTLDIKEKCTLQCLGCDKPTLEIMVVDKNSKYPKQILQVLCHRCGQLSFRKTYEECKVYYGVIEPYRLVDSQMISDEQILIEVR